MSHPKVPGQSRLVIGRREGERVFLGPDIEVRILENRGTTTRILFVVPEGMPVDRPSADQDAEDRAENATRLARRSRD